MDVCFGSPKSGYNAAAPGIFQMDDPLLKTRSCHLQFKSLYRTTSELCDMLWLNRAIMKERFGYQHASLQSIIEASGISNVQLFNMCLTVKPAMATTTKNQSVWFQLVEPQKLAEGKTPGSFYW
ncbi:hypothetical protein BDV26DRAFT_289194 [Aspergillus bertholletiae]|uniref:Uncharacterized protein n=1 Tax=Aspergillus bertholletiae TaxID=1226010 RepID=A0A5N7BJ00_9EURO|nr:hypothetical protein BDV26DRAFT_289194 [Aspergillus bertholletiae]